MTRRALLVGLVVLCTIAVPLAGGALAVGTDGGVSDAAGADVASLQDDGMNDSDSGTSGSDGDANDSDGDANDSMADDGDMEDDGSMDEDGDSDMSGEDGMEEDSMDDSGDDGDDSLSLVQILALLGGGGAVIGGVGYYVTRG